MTQVVKVPRDVFRFGTRQAAKSLHGLRDLFHLVPPSVLSPNLYPAMQRGTIRVANDPEGAAAQGKSHGKRRLSPPCLGTSILGHVCDFPKKGMPSRRCQPP